MVFTTLQDSMSQLNQTQQNTAAKTALPNHALPVATDGRRNQDLQQHATRIFAQQENINVTSQEQVIVDGDVEDPVTSHIAHFHNNLNQNQRSPTSLKRFSNN